MAINSSIFFRSRERVGSLFFDSVLRESHNFSVTSTEQPLEFGANIVDHAYVMPRLLEMDVMVGDIYFSFSTPSSYNLSKRSADALNRLNLLMVKREPLVVISNLVKYNNLLLVGISANQDKTNNSTLMATLSFKEALFVDSESIFVRNENPQYQRPVNSGTKVLRPA